MSTFIQSDDFEESDSFEKQAFQEGELIAATQDLIHQIVSLDASSSPVTIVNTKLQTILENTKVQIEKWDKDAERVTNGTLSNVFMTARSDDEMDEYGAVHSRDIFFGGEHVIEVNEHGEIELICFHTLFPPTSSLPDEVGKSIIAVSYEWKVIQGTICEWKDGNSVHCRNCRFIGGNAAKGGFDPRCLGKGRFWVDHLCCGPMPKGLTTIYKSFAIYSKCPRIVITDIASLERNATNVVTCYLAKENDSNWTVPSHQSRGWLVWEESSCSLTSLLLIKSPLSAILFSDSLIPDNDRYSEYSNAPLSLLVSVLPLLTTSFEATMTKIIYGKIPSVEESYRNGLDRERLGWMSFGSVNEWDYRFKLSLSELVRGVLQAGNMFDVYDIIEASQIFGLRSIVLPVILNSCASYDYLDGEERGGFPVDGYSWLPPVLVRSQTVEVEIKLNSSAPMKLWKLSKILRLANGVQPLIPTLALRGFAAALKASSLDVRQCIPILVNAGIAEEGILLHAAFFIETSNGWISLLPYKLIWELEVTMNPQEQIKCLTVTSESWEEQESILLPPNDLTPFRVGVQPGLPLIPSQEEKVLRSLQTFWKEETDELWSSIHQWTKKHRLLDEAIAKCPLLS